MRPEKFSKRLSFGGGSVRFFLLCLGSGEVGKGGWGVVGEWLGKLVGESGWGRVGEGLKRGLERGWGRVRERLAFYTSKTLFEDPMKVL